MDFLERVCKLLTDVCNGFFYLFVDLNLPALRKHSNEEPQLENVGFNRKLFECPGCKEIPEPPVFTCSSGHIVCILCKEAGPCSVCGGEFRGNARNFIVERIVTTNRFPCRFQDEGCHQILKVSELVGHQTQCCYRHCKCGIVGKSCDGTWVGSVNALYAHLVISHEMFYVFRDKKATLKAEFDPESNKFLRFNGPTVMLKVIQGKNYLIRTVYKEELNIVFTFIIGLYRDEGSKSPEFIYKLPKASIQLVLKDTVGAAQVTPTSERVWIGPVNTVDNKLEQISEEGKGLLLPWNKLLEEADITGEKLLTWDLQINVFPQKEVPSENSTQPYPISKQKFKGLLDTLLRPFVMSTWAIIAPGFTLAIIMFFVCFV